MTNAVIYTRFSPRPNAEECESNEKQEERCRAYCKRNGYRLMSVCSDSGLTGGTMDRPGLQDAIDTVREIMDNKPGMKAIGARLIADSSDRLARDMLVSLMIRHEIAKAGGRIEYANGTPVIEETPEGRLCANILAAFASYERDRVQYATSRGMKRRQANGEWFGKPPVGFMLDPECKTRLILCPQEQKALAMARSMKESGYPWSYISEYLNGHCGLFRGGAWKADTIRKAIAKEDIR